MFLKSVIATFPAACYSTLDWRGWGGTTIYSGVVSKNTGFYKGYPLYIVVGPLAGGVVFGVVATPPLSFWGCPRCMEPRYE